MTEGDCFRLVLVSRQCSWAEITMELYWDGHYDIGRCVCWDVVELHETPRNSVSLLRLLHKAVPKKQSQTQATDKSVEMTTCQASSLPTLCAVFQKDSSTKSSSALPAWERRAHSQQPLWIRAWSSARRSVFGWSLDAALGAYESKTRGR